MRKQKVHQTYGPGATLTACGLYLHTVNIITARPDSKVTCKTCNKVEAKRRCKVNSLLSN